MKGDVMYLPPPYYIDHLLDRRDPRPPRHAELTLRRRGRIAGRLRGFRR